MALERFESRKYWDAAKTKRNLRMSNGLTVYMRQVWGLGIVGDIAC